jgi:hypothetical protein
VRRARWPITRLATVGITAISRITRRSRCRTTQRPVVTAARRLPVRSLGATSGMAVGAAAASAVPTFKRWATNPTFRFDCEPTLPFFNRELIGKRAHLSGVVKSAATNRSG